MSHLSRLVTVGKWVNAMYPGYDTALSAVDRSMEEKMVRDHREIGVKLAPYGYARYGATLADVVAAGFAHDIGALKFGLQARIVSSGMAAIHAVLQAAHLNSARGDKIIAGSVLYDRTPKIMRRMAADYGICLQFVDAENAAQIVRQTNSFENKGKVFLFFETIGNGVPMPVFKFAAVLEELWERPVTLVLDNTFLTPALFNPFAVYQEIWERRGTMSRLQFVYVESLSKYYRAESRDHATAGVIIAPPQFIEACDDAIQDGFAIQYPQLKDFPIELAVARNRVIHRVSENARAAARYLRGHRLVRVVWYPDLSPGAGGVLYFELHDADPATLVPIMERGGIPRRSSFGHDDTTHIPFGAIPGGSYPPGLIRLAVGTKETPEEVVGKLAAALG